MRCSAIAQPSACRSWASRAARCCSSARHSRRGEIAGAGWRCWATSRPWRVSEYSSGGLPSVRGALAQAGGVAGDQAVRGRAWSGARRRRWARGPGRHGAGDQRRAGRGRRGRAARGSRSRRRRGAGRRSAGGFVLGVGAISLMRSRKASSRRLSGAGLVGRSRRRRRRAGVRRSGARRGCRRFGAAGRRLDVDAHLTLRRLRRGAADGVRCRRADRAACALARRRDSPSAVRLRRVARRRDRAARRSAARARRGWCRASPALAVVAVRRRGWRLRVERGGELVGVRADALGHGGEVVACPLVADVGRTGRSGR